MPITHFMLLRECLLSEKFQRKWGKKGSDDLIGIMDQVSNDLSLNFEVMGEDAQKILKQARARAENQRQR